MLVWARLNFRVNELEFEEALMQPCKKDPVDFQLVVEHRLLGSFALHEDFFLEQRESCKATWRQVSLPELKVAFLEASRNDGGVKRRKDEPWDLAGLDVRASQVCIPRIPVEGDDTHFDHARKAFERGEISYQIAGGSGSHGKIWGHATFLVDSLPRARALLRCAGFIPSSDSWQVLINSRNGWKVRLLEFS
jgi:hypothetical protein